MSRPAVFLDRDGTLIRDVHYIGNPEQVELLPGVPKAIRRLNQAGWPVIVVTNQSGIARGRFTASDYAGVERRLDELMTTNRARIDATYMCPHHPDFTGPCECRKPGTLLFRQAETERDVDASRSWYLGDKLRDVLPARELGGHGIMIPTGNTPPAELETARTEFELAMSLDDAVARIIKSAR